MRQVSDPDTTIYSGKSITGIIVDEFFYGVLECASRRAGRGCRDRLRWQRGRRRRGGLIFHRQGCRRFGDDRAKYRDVDRRIFIRRPDLIDVRGR